MNNLTKLLKIFFIIGLATTYTACASDKEALIKASKQYCSFYDPKSWATVADTGDTYSIYNFIVTRQEDEISSKAFKALVSSANNRDFSSFYISVRKAIEQATEEKWVCEDFDQFYMPSQKLVSLSLSGLGQRRIDPNGDNVIVITVTHSGVIVIAGAPLNTTEKNTIVKGIKMEIADRNIDELDIVLYFDEGANGNLTPKILTALMELGAKNISLIDY